MMVFDGGSRAVAGPMVTAFDVELLVLAKKRGYRIKEIPVTWRHVSTSRVSPLKDAYRMFKQVAQVWSYRLRGRYEPGRGGHGAGRGGGGGGGRSVRGGGA